jgi:DNA-binding winged helix-turn-helix (wHTH) protein/tetratricopeptide (TPR) repeat protein/TolB-like protein
MQPDLDQSAKADPTMLGPMRLSPREPRLYGADGDPVALERKAIDLLVYLVARRDRVVSKDELLQAVWGRSIASDSVIAQAVSKARKALANGNGDAAWIDVIRGVGYRYVGPAEAPSPPADLAEVGEMPVRIVRPMRFRWVAAALLLVVGAGLGVWWQQRAAQHDPLRIAVLPWRNETGDRGLDWTQLGLQGLIIDALASDRRVIPIAQSDVRSLLAARPDLVAAEAQSEYLSAATGAEHVLAGRLSRDGTGFHVELVELGENATESVVLHGKDVTSTALAASTGLTRNLLPGFDPLLPNPISKDAFANEAFARGVDARLHGDAESSARHLQAAVAADPAMLAARYQLSIAYQMLRRNEDWRSSLAELLVLSRARGDHTHEGMALSGQGILAWREGRLGDAENLLHEAGECFGNGSDVMRRASVEGNLGSLAAMRADFASAEKSMRHALTTYELMGNQVEIARVSKNLGILNLDRGSLDEAARWIERSLTIRQTLRLERDMAESLVAMAGIDLIREQPAAAQASYERAAAIFTRFNDPLLESDSLARMVDALAAQGRLRAAEQAAARSLASARLVDNPAALGLAHLKLGWVARLRGNIDGALEELDRAESHFQKSGQQQGLLRIELERARLADRENRESALSMVDSVRKTANERGYRVLEAEALLARAHLITGDPGAARLAMIEAFDLARSAGDGELTTLTACAIAKYEPPDADAQSSPPLARCLKAGMRHAEAAGVLADRAEGAGNPADALHWWRQRKVLAGEFWNSDDENRLARLEALAAQF